MEESIGALDSSPYESSPSIDRRRDNKFPISYDIVFSMSFLHCGNGMGEEEEEADRKKGYDGRLFFKWYKIKAYPESPLKLESEAQVPEISPFWAGRLPQLSTFAALGHKIHAFGGQLGCASDYVPFSPNVYEVDIFHPTNSLFAVAPMIFPRLLPQSLVLDGKLFILGGHLLTASTAWDIECPARNDDEVCDPTEKWDDWSWDIGPAEVEYDYGHEKPPPEGGKEWEYLCGCLKLPPTWEPDTSCIGGEDLWGCPELPPTWEPDTSYIGGEDLWGCADMVIPTVGVEVEVEPNPFSGWEEDFSYIGVPRRDPVPLLPTVDVDVTGGVFEGDDVWGCDDKVCEPLAGDSGVVHGTVIEEEEEDEDEYYFYDPIKQLGMIQKESFYSPAIEVYDPRYNKWEGLPDPLFPIDTHFICAALENPNRILVATPTLGDSRHPTFVAGEPVKACFFIYDLTLGYWEMLDNSERNFHPKCPLEYGVGKALTERNLHPKCPLEKALTVGSTLYWITDDAMLLAYRLEDDLWLLGNLKAVGISFLDENSEPCSPFLLHLEYERFCLLHFTFGVVHCVIIDVVDNLLDKSLAISVVCTHRYKVDSPSVIQDCFLM